MIQFFGLYSATVLNNVDPGQLGRIQISFTLQTAQKTKDFEAWAPLSSLMAEKSQGTLFIPDIGDEVIITFGKGNPDKPYVLGTLMTQLFGLYPATVINNLDPEELGRVEISFHDNDEYTVWARLSTLMAGNNKGSWFIPDIDDEVIVGFEKGNPRSPYVLGSLWNAQNTPPAVSNDYRNNQKIIQTRSGIKITFDDQMHHEKVTIETPAGQSITFDDGESVINISDRSGNTIELNTNGIEINSNSKVSISAATTEINSAIVSINSGLAKFSGTVQCDTLIANSVVSTSYTPGEGNVL